MHRLAIVIDHPIQYHAPLYGHLARDGRFEIRVFFLSDRGARAYYEPFAKTTVQYDNPILDGYDHVFLHEGEPRTWWERRTELRSMRLGSELVRWQPDAVYFHGYTNPTFWLAMLDCRKAAIPILFRGENEDVIPRPRWRNAVRESFLRIFLRYVDAVLYIGQKNREFFQKRGYAEDRLFFVPYCVDDEYFATTAERRVQLRSEIRERYGFPREARVFIYTHKLRDRMRPLDAVEGFCRALPRIERPVGLILCGNGELRERAEVIASEHGRGRIAFAGYLGQADLRDYMLASDVMLNPAVEPWGTVVNEGLACGLAMICGDLVAGWPDMVVPGENGLVHRAGNIDEIADGIVEMASMPDDSLERMRTASLALLDTLSFETCADGIAAAMDRVIPG